MPIRANSESRLRSSGLPPHIAQITDAAYLTLWSSVLSNRPRWSESYDCGCIRGRVLLLLVIVIVIIIVIVIAISNYDYDYDYDYDERVECRSSAAFSRLGHS